MLHKFAGICITFQWAAPISQLNGMMKSYKEFQNAQLAVQLVC